MRGHGEDRMAALGEMRRNRHPEDWLELSFFNGVGRRN